MASIKQTIINTNDTSIGTNIWHNIRVTKVGVQGAPGAKFSINGKDNVIILGNTGIYELDVTDIGVLTSFYPQDLNGEIMYVDYVYEGVAL